MDVVQRTLSLWEGVNSGEITLSGNPDVLDVMNEHLSELIHTTMENAALTFGSKTKLCAYLTECGEAPASAIHEYVKAYDWLADDPIL